MPASNDTADAYFSADVETDGPIPGPYSMLSLGIAFAGRFDGKVFERPTDFKDIFYRELKPISNEFQLEALRVNQLDRDRLCREGEAPENVMLEASNWITAVSGRSRPVLVAYPLCFDWTWIYWYFTKFNAKGSPFGYSNCLDMKTAYAIKAKVPIASAGRSKIEQSLRARRTHTHNALADAIEQAEIFANIFEWKGRT